MIVVDVALMRRTINKEPNMAENITSSLRVEDTDGERLAATVETKNGKVDIYIGETDGRRTSASSRPTPPWKARCRVSTTWSGVRDERADEEDDEAPEVPRRDPRRRQGRDRGARHEERGARRQAARRGPRRAARRRDDGQADPRRRRRQEREDPARHRERHRRPRRPQVARGLARRRPE